jgi:hypothetical protein
MNPPTLPGTLLPGTLPSGTLRLWRLAGALALAHIVLLFAGVALEQTPLLGASAADTTTALVHSPLSTVYAGGYVEYLGFLVFLIGALLLARLLRGTSETSGWLAACISGTAVTYTAVTVATGFAAGAAALYNGHHGAPLATITTVNDVRNFAFFLSVGVLGVFTMAVAGAVHATRTLPRWLAYTGYVVGPVCIAAVPLARWGAIDSANLLWLVWFLAFAVAALRGPRSVPAAAPAVPVGA